LLNWVPVHFLGSNWRANPGAGWITIGLPLGMAVGALSAGLVADRWCPERGPHGRLPDERRGRGNASPSPGAGHGFHGLPLARRKRLLGVRTPGLLLGSLSGAGRPRAFRNGHRSQDAVAYAFAAGGQILIGRAIDITQSTTSAFFVIGAACIVGALVILPVRE
jgi:OPA family glycerol-3-phosphate transporter-like MFS transporter